MAGKWHLSRMVSFLFWYAPVLLVQLSASWVTLRSPDAWYQGLERAPWNPPGWVFGPAWTVLYLLMAVSAWMVYWSEAALKQRRSAYLAFFAQLLANGLWSFLFFGMHQPGWALLDLGLLILLIVLMISLFYRVKPLAGWLQLPYLAWTIYAFTLNAYIWWWN